MPLALGVMIGLYFWMVLRRTRSGALLPTEITRVDRLMRFLRIGLIMTSVVTVGLMIQTSSTKGIRTDGSSDLLQIFLTAGTIISYALTLAAIVWCVMYYREAAQIRAGKPES